MIEWLVNRIFWWDKLRTAVFAEVHMYDAIDEALKEPTNNLTWCDEDGLWKGWYFNQKYKIYRFDDVGHESLMELWDANWQWDLELDMGYL